MGVGIPFFQQQERGECPAESSIPILEGMNLQERDHKRPDHQERMVWSVGKGLVGPLRQIRHESWGIERFRCLEHHAKGVAIGIERGDGIGKRFVIPAVPVILGAVGKQEAMKLPNRRFGEWHGCPVAEDQLQDIRVTSDFLFIPALERASVEVGEKRIDLRV